MAPPSYGGGCRGEKSHCLELVGAAVACSDRWHVVLKQDHFFCITTMRFFVHKPDLPAARGRIVPGNRSPAPTDNPPARGQGAA